MDGFNADLYRKDACGAWIIWDKYGDTDSIYGWQVDHICPQNLLSSLGYSQTVIDNPKNIRDLQHQNNASKGDDYPEYHSVVTSKGLNKIEERHTHIVDCAKREELRKFYGIDSYELRSA